MGGTHKKKLRAEKAKVKLKGATLPKGLNITKTEFKVRKINIRQQHSEDLKYVEGQRIISIKESLKRLEHNSPAAKIEGLRNLRESIENKQPEIYAQRATIVQALSSMCLEIERDPRRESFRTLSTFLSTLTSCHDIAPFFHIISSHLRCAMTHITRAIQEDSLLMLDVLLKYTPNQVAADSERILQNFLEMISRVRAEGDRVSRTLDVQVLQSQTAVKWRTKVLLRLQQMLHTLFTYNGQEYAKKSANLAETRIHMFKVNEPQYYGIKRVPLVADNAALFVMNLKSMDMDSMEKETLALQAYIEHLMPLLFESWIEVRPQISANNAQIYLNNDAGNTLKIVVNIILCLWYLVKQHEMMVKHNKLSLWFQKQYAVNFIANFLSQFPYQQLQQEEQSVKRGKRGNHNQCVSIEPSLRQNLDLVQLFCLFFNGQNNNKINNIKAKNLLVYVNDVIEKIEQHHWYGVEDYQSLIVALNALLLKNVNILMKNHNALMLQLLHTTMNAFLEHHIPTNSGIIGDVLLLLCQIAESPQLYGMYGGDEEFAIFLQKLPLLLLKANISDRALMAMSSLAKQNNRLFLKSLEAEIKNIILNIQRIQVSNAVNAFEGRKKIINLFYWTCRAWRESNDEKLHLKNLIDQNIPDKRVSSYFHYIIE